MRWTSRLRGSNVGFSGIDLRGPVLNSQMTPSVRPLKWQLEQLCQPSLDSRSLLVAGPIVKLPREEKNTSAPAATCSCCDPGAGDGAVLMTFATRSVVR